MNWKFRTACEMWDNLSVHRIRSGDEEFLEFLGSVRQKLGGKGATGPTADYVEGLLMEAHQRYHELLVGEENKRKALLNIIYGLEVRAAMLAEALLTTEQCLTVCVTSSLGWESAREEVRDCKPSC